MHPIRQPSQLPLDLLSQAAPSLRNFVPGRNRECLELLDAIARGTRSQRFIYLWGQQGSGRSHLLSALDEHSRLLTPDSPLEHFAFDEHCTVYAADDVERLDEHRQESLFHLFNQVLANPGAVLVCAGDRPPLALQVREDLRTRLGWGLVFELHLLDDEDKARALRALANERGVSVAPDVLPWLLTHRSRDIRQLLAEFDAIDRFALACKRPITLALVRDWLASLQAQMQFGAIEGD